MDTTIWAAIITGACGIIAVVVGFLLKKRGKREKGEPTIVTDGDVATDEAKITKQEAGRDIY
jgi:hypothetical protein